MKLKITEEKIMGIKETKDIFFEKISNINKCLAKLSKKKNFKLPISEKCRYKPNKILFQNGKRITKDPKDFKTIQ